MSHPTYEPGTKVLVRHDSLAYKSIPPDAIVDENGTPWVKAEVVATYQPFFFRGYRVRLPNKKVVPIHADDTKPCPNQTE